MENFSFFQAILASVSVLVLTGVLSQFRSNPLIVVMALSAVLLNWFLDTEFPVSFLGMQSHTRVFFALWNWWVFESFVFASTNIVFEIESMGIAMSAVAVIASFVCSAGLKKYPEAYKTIACGALAIQTFLPTPDRVFFLESVPLSVLKAALLSNGYIGLCHAILSGKLETSRAIDIYFVSHFWIMFSHAYVLAAYPFILAGVYFYHSAKQKSAPTLDTPATAPLVTRESEDALLKRALEEAKRKQQLGKHQPGVL